MAQWQHFVSALESRGLAFEQVRHSSNRPSIIAAAGFADPFDVAVLETEWMRRVKSELNKSQGGPADVAASNLASSSSPPASSRSATAAASTKATNAMASLGAKDLSTAQLLEMPEELQDSVVAEELLHVLMGIGGRFIRYKKDQGGSSRAKSFECAVEVPLSMRSSIERVLDVAHAFQHLNVIASAEIKESLGLVATALAEVVSDVCASYLEQIGKLHDWARTHPMPLVKVIADVRRVGYPVIRLSRLLDDIRNASEGGGFPQGGMLLQALHNELTRASGNADDEKLLTLVLRRAAAPYLSMLGKWMHEGVLEDQYREFFVVEAKQTLLDEDPSLRWEKRFRMKPADQLPHFLEKDGIGKAACYAGRLRCLLRELVGDGAVITNKKSTTITWGDTEELARIVREANESASSAVIGLLFDPKYDLVGHFTSLKHYFLHDRGDWLVDFLDAADELLDKAHGQVKGHAVRVLLQSAVSKGCSADRFHTLVGCTFDQMTLPERLQAIIVHQGSSATSTARPMRASMKVESRRCIELLQLDFNVEWPLSMIINKAVIGNLNCIFRLLLWVRVCERQMVEAWGQKNNQIGGHIVSVKQQMVQFLRQFQFYASHFVIEPLWGDMMSSVVQSEGVAGIMNAVRKFSDAAFDRLILSNPNRFHHLSAILTLITKFADLGRHAASNRAPPSLLRTTVPDIERKFHEHMRELANPNTEGYSHLISMLTWMDFSRYYERNQVYRVVHSAAAEDELMAMQTESAYASREGSRDTQRQEHEERPRGH